MKTFVANENDIQREWFVVDAMDKPAGRLAVFIADILRGRNKPVFDFIHSTYALPFAANPVKVIADAAALLKSGGVFLLTTGHPLYAGEWLEIGDDDEDGLFMPDYFHPEADVRMSLDDQTMTAAHYHPLAAVRIDS